MELDFQPLVLSSKLACVTTVILLLIGIPLAYWLSFSQRRYKYILEALVTMPLVLPPTVLGFYLLILLGPRSFLGGILDSWFDVRMVFSFAGLVVGSVIFSLPFMVNPIKAGFQSLPVYLTEAALTLGKSRRETLFEVLLPNIKPSLWTGIVMSFAHTLGEFGVVLMIGGNIPGQTRVASIAIYSEVESLNYSAANFYSLILVGVSFGILFVFYLLNKRTLKVF